MFPWIKHNGVARYWQKVALAVYEMGEKKPKSWNCKYRVPYMVKKMKAEGLVANRDFAIERGYVEKKDGTRGKHIRLTVYGHLVDPSSKNRTAGFITGSMFNQYSWRWGKYRRN